VQGLHVNEAPGRDLVADGDGCWRDLVGKCEAGDEEADEPETEVPVAPAPRSAEAGDSGSNTPATAGEASEPRKRAPRRKAGATTPLWHVDAGPIEHRIPSMGYIIIEPPQYLPLDTATLLPLLEAEREALAALPEPITNPRSILSRLTSTRQPFTLPSGLVLDPPPLSTEPSRKIVIMGDCAGVSNDAFEELAREPSLLVHECTNAWIDPGVEKGEKGARVRTAELDKTIRSTSVSAGTGSPAGTPGGQPANGAADAAGPGGEEWIKMEQERVRKILAAKAVVEQKARSRGHSTPDMVGAFARRIGARRVALNHFSAM
jgi:ribonuclease Z